MIALWPSARKELTLCCFTLCRLNSLVFGTGCGIRLYRFLIIAFSSTFKLLYLVYISILSLPPGIMDSLWSLTVAFLGYICRKVSEIGQRITRIPEGLTKIKKSHLKEVSLI